MYRDGLWMRARPCQRDALDLLSSPALLPSERGEGSTTQKRQKAPLPAHWERGWSEGVLRGWGEGRIRGEGEPPPIRALPSRRRRRLDVLDRLGDDRIGDCRVFGGCFRGGDGAGLDRYWRHQGK